MNKTYEITIFRRDAPSLVVGTMLSEDITFNRYNEGLLIAAGKLSKHNLETETFLKFETLFRHTANMQFRGEEKTYTGDFCFINFIPESHIVVFGSTGPVTESETITEEDLKDDESTTIQTLTVPPAARQRNEHVERLSN